MNIWNAAKAARATVAVSMVAAFGAAVMIFSFACCRVVSGEQNDRRRVYSLTLAFLAASGPGR